MNRSPRAIGFVPPRAAWLFGHAAGTGQRRLQTVLLGLASLLLAAAVAFWWGQRGPSLPMPPVTLVPAPRVEAVVALPNAAERARINRVVRRLNTPWGSIFQALEAQSSASVSLLALETDADRGAVRVLTEGPSLDELLQHAERVQGTSPFVRTKLLRIEAPEAGAATGSPAGLTRLSFDLVIQP